MKLSRFSALGIGTALISCTPNSTTSQVHEVLANLDTAKAFTCNFRHKRGAEMHFGTVARQAEGIEIYTQEAYLPDLRTGPEPDRSKPLYSYRYDERGRLQAVSAGGDVYLVEVADEYTQPIRARAKEVLESAAFGCDLDDGLTVRPHYPGQISADRG